MSFGFKHRRNVEAQVRAIAGEQIENGLAEAADTSADVGDTVHGLRRRCKKLRGLVRLVGPDLDGADKENAAFRDAAASLAQARDAAVMVDSFAAVLKFDREGDEQIARIDAEEIADLLETRARAPGQVNAEPFAEFSDIFGEAAERVRKWKVDGRGFDALGDGFERIYKRLRQGLEVVEDEASPDNLHEWRKSVKYHGHHVSLLKRTAPQLLKARLAALTELGDLLGAHHDLAVLSQALEDVASAGAVHDVIVRQQDGLVGDAMALGRQLAAEKPGAIRRRFEAYWELLEERG